MPRTPDPEKVQARHALICALLDISRLACQGELNRLHPDAYQCLPVPTLELPDITSYAQTARAIFLNLFTPDGNHKAPKWVAAAETCPHLEADAISAAYELVYYWYGLLGSAMRFRDAQARRWEFDSALECLQARLTEIRFFSDH